MNVALVLLVLAAGLAGCAGDDSDRATTAPPAGSAVGPGLSVAQAKASTVAGPMLVRGALLVDADRTRLCEALLESSPPQCGEPSLEVRALDLSQLALERGGDVRWAEEVKLLGTIEGGVLTVTPTASG
ncbi:MAG: hypothetical protein ICV59_09780 [Thermoleophilia bacterium]|nr:hypothetical protein [Thermoleophilia bacterium]